MHGDQEENEGSIELEVYGPIIFIFFYAPKHPIIRHTQGRRIERVQSQLPRPLTSPALPGHNPAEHLPLNRMMSERSHHHNPAAHPHSRPMHVRGKLRL